MALTESLCTQNIRASGHAPLAQASGTVQIAAYPTSRMACLTPPLHRSITVWTIWPSPTTTGTPIDTPATGTSGTEADLWVRLKDLFNSPKVVCSKTCILSGLAPEAQGSRPEIARSPGWAPLSTVSYPLGIRLCPASACQTGLPWSSPPA